MAQKFTLLSMVVISTLVSQINAQNIFHNNYIDFNKNGRMDIYENPAKPVEERLADLMSQMSFDEMYHQVRSETYLDIYNWDPVEKPLGHLGHIAHIWAAGEATDRVNYVQRKQIEGTRLGIPLIIFEEALHGLKTEKATSFPQAISLASTWNIGLMEQISTAIATETKSRGIRQVLSPVVDLARDPRWGRAQETYGEDPFLASKMAVAFCKSFEDRGVITTPKHFVANSGDAGRDSWAMYLSERILEELYFPPYKACINQAGSRSIMPSYNTLNGVPTVADHWLLTKKARDEWDFKGFYGSDFNAVSIIKDLHRLTDKDEEVAAMAFNAGMDVEWPKAWYYDEPLLKAIETGLVKRQTVEDAAKRILRVKFEIGLFDNPFGDKEKAVAVNESAEHVAIALEAARQGIVLLKNENNTLPLKGNDLKKILVVGQLAANQKLGNYSGTGMKLVSFLDGIKNHLPDAEILYHRGIESSATLFTPIKGNIFDAGENKTFKAEIFDNTNFEGLPYVTQNYNRLFLRSHGGAWGAPSPGQFWSNKSMRITTNYLPDIDHNSGFMLEATGQMRFIINGEEVLNNLGTQGKKDGFFDDAVGQIGVLSDLGNPQYIANYTFKKGQTYKLTIEYIHTEVRHLQLSLNWDQRIGMDEDVAEIHRLAEKADAVIMFPGGIVEGEFLDRSSAMYPPEEEALINSMSVINKPFVVVMVNGAAMATANWNNSVPAIVENWYSGQEGGNALAEILLGKTNPSGKIPVTFPQTDGQLPLTYDFRPVGRSTGFQDPLKGKPQYPFGHGLSYTTFLYSDLALSKKAITSGESVTLTFKVTNTGKIAGSEVSQLYIHQKFAAVVRPLKQLKGFSRTGLEPGQTKTIKITLTPDELSLLNTNMQYEMMPGEVELYIGSSSEDIRLTGQIDIK
jgi:beta-glucosidase